jgi:hypothetical protein
MGPLTMHEWAKISHKPFSTVYSKVRKSGLKPVGKLRPQGAAKTQEVYDASSLAKILPPFLNIIC